MKLNKALTKQWDVQAFAYLGNVAVDDAVPVVHDEVIQLFVGNVVKRTVLTGKHHAVVGAHLLK